MTWKQIGDEESKPPLVVFSGCGCFAIAVVLAIQGLVAFLTVVVPATLGPVLQATGVVTVILGCRLVAAPTGGRTTSFVWISGGLAALGWIIGLNSYQVSDAKGIPVLGVGLLSVSLAVSLAVLLEITRLRMPTALRVALGLLLVLAGMIVPTLIEAHYLVDLL